MMVVLAGKAGSWPRLAASAGLPPGAVVAAVPPGAGRGAAAASAPPGGSGAAVVSAPLGGSGAAAASVPVGGVDEVGAGLAAGGRGAGVVRVLVAEDMRILRDTLVAVLNLESDIEVVAEVADGGAIVAAAVSAQPDVAVVDIDLPGADGLTAAAGLAERCPRCAVLILTVLGNPGNLRRALAAQVAGFLPKDTPAGELVGAVRAVAAGRRVFDQELILSALEVPGNPLSPREAEVLARYAGGTGPADIAAGLHLSYGTVRNYLASAVTKLGARNRVDAVRIAAEAGWL